MPLTPSEGSVGGLELGLTAPHPVRVIGSVGPIPPFHNGKVNFTNIGEIIKESLGLCYGMAICESELQSLPGHVLDAAGEVNYLVLVFGLPGYVAVMYVSSIGEHVAK